MDLTILGNPRKKRRVKRYGRKKNPATLPAEFSRAKKSRPVYYEKGGKFYRSPLKRYPQIEGGSIDSQPYTPKKFLGIQVGGKAMRRTRKNPMELATLGELANPRRRYRRNPISSTGNVITDFALVGGGTALSFFGPKALKLTGIKKYLAQGGITLAMAVLGQKFLGRSVSNRITLGLGAGLALTLANELIFKGALMPSTEPVAGFSAEPEIIIEPVRGISADESEGIGAEPEYISAEPEYISAGEPSEYVGAEPEYISEDDMQEEVE